MSELTAHDRLIIDVDTIDTNKGQELVSIAAGIGATTVRFGPQFAAITGWPYCSGLARDFGLRWLADMQQHTDAQATRGIIGSLAKLTLPPMAITMHLGAGLDAVDAGRSATIKEMDVQKELDALEAAQEAARPTNIHLFGIPVPVSLGAGETEQIYGEKRRAAVGTLIRTAAWAEFAGVVVGRKDLPVVAEYASPRRLLSMVPVPTGPTIPEWDPRVGDPISSIRAGADFAIVGQSLLMSEDPPHYFETMVAGVGAVLEGATR